MGSRHLFTSTCLISLALLGAFGCSEDDSAASSSSSAQALAGTGPLSPSEIVGSLACGRTASTAYTGTPAYQAYSFVGAAHEVVDISVNGSAGSDAEVWLLRSDFSEVASNDSRSTIAQISTALPKTETYYVALKEKHGKSSAFAVALSCASAGDAGARQDAGTIPEAGVDSAVSLDAGMDAGTGEDSGRVAESGADSAASPDAGAPDGPSGDPFGAFLGQAMAMSGSCSLTVMSLSYANATGGCVYANVPSETGSGPCVAMAHASRDGTGQLNAQIDTFAEDGSCYVGSLIDLMGVPVALTPNGDIAAGTVSRQDSAWGESGAETYSFQLSTSAGLSFVARDAVPPVFPTSTPCPQVAQWSSCSLAAQFP